MRAAGSQRGSRVQWRLCADYECLKGQMQAGRARIKRTPCREETMDATCRSVPQHLGTAVRVLWGCQAWAVGVCWRASFGKVEMQNESLRKRFRACSVEGCRCY